MKCVNEIQGYVFLNYSCILQDSSACSEINMAMKKKIHEGGRYFLRCERALSVLGPVQMDRKAHSLSEKPLNDHETISQSLIFKSPTWKQTNSFYLNATNSSKTIQLFRDKLTK